MSANMSVSGRSDPHPLGKALQEMLGFSSGNAVGSSVRLCLLCCRGFRVETNYFMHQLHYFNFLPSFGVLEVNMNLYEFRIDEKKACAEDL